MKRFPTPGIYEVTVSLNCINRLERESEELLLLLENKAHPFCDLGISNDPRYTDPTV
jgi:hypothetical protein